MGMTIRYGSSYRWAAPTRAALSVLGATLLQVTPSRRLINRGIR
jgi:hypothetical protein